MLLAVRFLVAAQSLAVGVAVAAAFVEIETIVYSGPALTLSSVLIIAGALCVGSPEIAVFGLAVPAISAICFSLIYRNSWSPDQASRPISLLLLALGTFAAVFGMYVFRRTHDNTRFARESLMRFRLSTLMQVMTALALPMALHRAGPVAEALGVALGYGLLLALVIRSDYRARKRTEELASADGM